ncbi:FMN-dependent NADH-azoreductase [Bradyrhizobium sp. Ash2021]|uniref:FMN-dependent NADH-azoreductase n=1 Tax=Bradyrhizobium sp. Ash2021 TaxID=2954771 RepID=UPI0028163F17|nr:FMN-dependent NADH-azoreductase [Bradyrhizobium sp. Ash2021]WMT76411.1 FMN-dependent NADH-azoreductase [Bradyrhizobium sp. Ash2021]
MQILRIDSSPQRPSVSHQLSGELVAELKRLDPSCQVVHRDLGSEPLAHLSHDAVVPIRTPEASTPAQKAAKALSDALIEELEAAELIVIGSPMYNFGITSQLKAWFDYVVRAGRTFRYTPEGPIGLLRDKRAVLILTRGGVHSTGPARARDYQEPHLRTLLGFVGITEVSTVLAEGLGIGAESRERGLAAARTAIAGGVAGFAVSNRESEQQIGEVYLHRKQV